MRFLSAASGKSVWRGLDYHHAGRVKSVRQTGPSEYEGEVWGGAPEPYHVRIDVDHPRRSVCDCPHAKDRLVVCKHKVALFFAAFPDAEGEFLREVEEEEREYEAEMERWKAEPAAFCADYDRFLASTGQYSVLELCRLLAI